jgi:hypothetical protein
MPAKNPRLALVLEQPLYNWVRKKALQDGVSVSAEVRDLLKEISEQYEDLYWARESQKRFSTINRGRLVAHEAVKRKFKVE